jgi:hypothetical protein
MQAPVKSATAKMMRKFRKTGSLLDKNRNRHKSVLTPGILQDDSNGHYKISPQIFAEIKCTKGYFFRFSPHCGEEESEILPIPNAGFSRANSWRQC